MFGQPNPQRDRDRFTNAAITRAQLRAQWAKLRESIPHWYRRFTGQKPAGR